MPARRRLGRGRRLLVRLEVVGVGEVAAAREQQHDHRRDQPLGAPAAASPRASARARRAGRASARGSGSGGRLERRCRRGRRRRFGRAAAQAHRVVVVAARQVDRARGQHLRPGDDGRADHADVGLLHAQPDGGDAGQAIADLGAEMELQHALDARDLLGLQPRLGAPPAVVGQMRIRPLLALDRDRQPVRRGVELGDPEDGVARLGLAVGR